MYVCVCPSHVYIVSSCSAEDRILFATTTPHTTGYFRDEGIIYALQKFRSEPNTMMNLAHLLLWVWAEHMGQSAPTVIDIGCYFETEDHCNEVVKEWFESPQTVPGAV